MTPGQEALAEAMRLEQARIYGNLSPARVFDLSDNGASGPARVPAPVDLEAARRRRKGAA